MGMVNRLALLNVKLNRVSLVIFIVGIRRGLVGGVCDGIKVMTFCCISSNSVILVIDMFIYSRFALQNYDLASTKTHCLVSHYFALTPYQTAAF